MSVLLQVKDLAIHTRAGMPLLQGAALQLNAGERLTIVGESGAGKSILAQAIMGTLPDALHASGSICIAGQATDGLREKTQPLWGRVLTMLPQEPWTALSPLMRMQPQVAESARYAAGQSWPAAQKAALERMTQLGIGPAAQQWLHQISGGMAQRVGVASLGLAGAQLLLADEPTKGLDAGSAAAVAQLLQAAAAQDQALLTITHDLELARLLGGKLMVMQRGAVVESGAADEVLQNPQHAYTQQLVAAQPKNWKPLVQPFASQSTNEAVIEGNSLSKAFGRNQLFKERSIALQRGEIMAISGTSGCGKTTLGNILLGVVKPDAGLVHRANLPTHRFGKLYQDPPAAFAPQRRLRDAMQDLAQLHGLNLAKLPQLLSDLGLQESLLERLPSEVSGGELQRIALARLLLIEPAFIFADEPTSRLDVITQQHTMQLLVRSMQENNCAMLLVSHDADLARACSHSQTSMHTQAIH
jgi:ABC-type glutathione transport system ATPase component